jgi:3-oxoacyl-[acyl-carrier-protein] synthase II
MTSDRQVWVTGIGLLSSLGEGVDAHLGLLDCGTPDSGPVVSPVVNESRFSPWPVHPLVAYDVSKQIPKASEQRQMGPWQRAGVYAAGLALADAGLLNRPEFLEKTDLVTAAGNGERDLELDRTILEAIGAESPGGQLNQALAKGLRPTLYLGELSNLLAGNISIVHKATGSSRTFKGEEMAGVAAVENAVRRIHAGQGDLFLVGGALNAEREDLLLNYELGGNLWAHPFRSVWQRGEKGGGFIPGSVGVFLVLEARGHGEARGTEPYARISAVVSDRSRRNSGEVPDGIEALFDAIAGQLDPGPLGVLSGASGVEPITRHEAAFLQRLEGKGHRPAVRAYGTQLGHTVEAHFPLGIALAALALREGRFMPPLDTSGVEKPHLGTLDRILVTALGHWRGEGLALVEPGARGSA